MTDIRYLKGVGEKRAGLLNKLGIFTIEQLFEYYPRDYRDFSQEMLVSDCESGENACIKATLISNVKEHMVRRGMTLYKCDFTDGKTVIHATLFNQKIFGKIPQNIRGLYSFRKNREKTVFCRNELTANSACKR